MINNGLYFTNFMLERKNIKKKNEEKNIYNIATMVVQKKKKEKRKKEKRKKGKKEKRKDIINYGLNVPFQFKKRIK